MPVQFDDLADHRAHPVQALPHLLAHLQQRVPAAADLRLQDLGLHQQQVAVLRAIEDAADLDDQLARRERLDQVVVRAEPQPLQPALRGRVGGDHDDRQEAEERVPAQRVEDLEAAAGGQARVEDHQVGLAAADRLQSGRAVVRREHLVSAAGEGDLQKFDHAHVVVDDEDRLGLVLGFGRHRHSRRRETSPAGAAGLRL